MKKYFKIFILILVLAFTCVLTGCKTPVNDVGDTINDLIVEKGEERGIRLTKKNAKNDDGSYTITATVTPIAASNNKLTWTLDCDDENFVDAYDISDFVQLTVSDDTLSANVKYLQAFPVQLKLIVSSISNPDVIATCTLDCYKRVSNITDYTVRNPVDEVYSFNSSYSIGQSYSVIDFTSVSYALFFEHDLSYTFSDLTYGYTGTINSNLLINYYLNFDESIYDKCNSLGYNPEDLMEITEVEVSPNSESGNLNLQLYSWMLSRSGIAMEDTRDQMLEVLFACEYWFTLRIQFNVTDDSGNIVQTKNEYIRFKFNITEVPEIAVTGVSLDHSSVVF